MIDNHGQLGRTVHGDRLRLVGPAVAVLASGVLYALYLRPRVAQAGSAIGLMYGMAGSAALAGAGLLAWRKEFGGPGSAGTWRRAHLWLGLSSVPLLLLHSGFRVGGALTAVMTWLLAVVAISGVVAAYLERHLLVRAPTDVAGATFLARLASVRARLREEAEAIVEKACAPPDGGLPPPTEDGSTIAEEEPGGRPSDIEAPGAAPAADAKPLRDFYVEEMRPFLEKPASRHFLCEPGSRRARFDRVLALVPASTHAAVSALERICAQERELLADERLHACLQGTLLVHVPLSFALMALAVVHIAVALRY